MGVDTNSIPESDWGKLMYYMKAVCTCLEISKTDIPKRLRNPEKRRDLTRADKARLLAWVERLSPERLSRDGVFADYDELLLPGLPCVFFVPQDGRVSWNVTPVVNVEGWSFRVNAVMVHEKKLTKKVWKKPIKRVREEEHESSSSENRKDDEACSCLCCLMAVLCCCCQLMASE